MPVCCCALLLARLLARESLRVGASKRARRDPKRQPA
jgi:hypothetical protein